jgi:hypothetical protein
MTTFSSEPSDIPYSLEILNAFYFSIAALILINNKTILLAA